MPQPTRYRWRAPTQFTDGVAIDVPLDYEIGQQGLDPATGNPVIEPFYTVVGALQPGTSPEFYEAPVGDMVFAPGQTTLAIRAVNRSVSPARFSAWSNTDTFTVTDGVPESPFEFSVEF